MFAEVIERLAQVKKKCDPDSTRWKEITVKWTIDQRMNEDLF